MKNVNCGFLNLAGLRTTEVKSLIRQREEKLSPSAPTKPKSNLKPKLLLRCVNPDTRTGVELRPSRMTRAQQDAAMYWETRRGYQSTCSPKKIQGKILSSSTPLY